MVLARPLTMVSVDKLTEERLAPELSLVTAARSGDSAEIPLTSVALAVILGMARAVVAPLSLRLLALQLQPQRHLRLRLHPQLAIPPRMVFAVVKVERLARVPSGELAVRNLAFAEILQPTVERGATRPLVLVLNS
jgi:hypothetical protein